MATDMNVYFCDPESPWQRGSNENTNGVLRQYFPKGTDLSQYSAENLQAVDDARKLDTFNARKVNSFRHPNSCRRSSTSRSADCRRPVPLSDSWRP